MTWLIATIAFLSASAFAPILLDMASGPRWAVLSLCLLLAGFTDWRWTTAHRLGLLWLGLIALSAAWAISWQNVIVDFWHWAVLGAVFCLGSSLDAKAVRPVLLAWALAIGLQGPLAAAQWALGKGALFPEVIWPAGLFVNKNFLSEAGLVASIIAVRARAWWLLPLTLMALIIPASKAAVIGAAVVGLPCLWSIVRWRVFRIGLVAAGLAVAGVIVNALTYMDWTHTSMADRLSFWANSLAMFADRPWGVGADNYWAAYPLYNDAWMPTGEDAYVVQMRPDHAHNEIINIMAELGVQGILVFGLLCYAAIRGSARTWWPVLGAILVVGMASFPLALPATGFVAALVLGHLAGGGGRARRLPARERSAYGEGQGAS